jgi:hypothetical protein
VVGVASSNLAAPTNFSNASQIEFQARIAHSKPYFLVQQYIECVRVSIGGQQKTGASSGFFCFHET